MQSTHEPGLPEPSQGIADARRHAVELGYTAHNDASSDKRRRVDAEVFERIRKRPVRSRARDVGAGSWGEPAVCGTRPTGADQGADRTDSAARAVRTRTYTARRGVASED